MEIDNDEMFENMLKSKNISYNLKKSIKNEHKRIKLIMEQNIINYQEELNIINNDNVSNLWVDMFKTGNIDKNVINKVNKEGESVLEFLFKSILKRRRSFEINKGFDLNELLNNLKEIPISKLENQPLIIITNYFELMKAELKLNKSHWNKIIELTNKKQLNEGIEGILKYKNDKKIVENIIEPIIEKKMLTKENNTKMLFALINAGFQERIILKNEVLEYLIENSHSSIEQKNNGMLKSLLDNILEKHLLWIKDQVSQSNDYIDFISEENFQKIIDKANTSEVVAQKEWMINYNKFSKYKELYKSNRNKVINKFIKTDIEKLIIYTKAKDERVFKKPYIRRLSNVLGDYGLDDESTIGDKSIFNDNIDDIVDRVIKSSEHSCIVLEHWAKNRFISDNKSRLDDVELKSEHIKKLIGAIDHKSVQRLNDITEQLLKNITIGNEQQNIPYAKNKDLPKIPYLKELLDKNKQIPEGNSFLITYYFQESFNHELNLTEEEFKSYINKYTTNQHWNNFLGKCITQNISNPKRTQRLVSFAIDTVNLNHEHSTEVITEILNKIESANNDLDKYKLKDQINHENLIKLLTKEIMVGERSKKVLFLIDKIEDIWNIKVRKETIFNKIDFLNMDFKYQSDKEEKPKVQSILSNINKYYIKPQKVGWDLVEMPIYKKENIWNELLEYKDKKGERIYSNEDIKLMISKISFEDQNIRKNIVESILEENNQDFIKILVKEDPVFFENLINSIINNSLNNKYREKTEKLERGSIGFLSERIKNNKEDEIIFLTDLTKKLLKLREFVEFSEGVVLASYQECDKSKITQKEINKAGITTLMEEEDLNNIDIAHNLVKKNKENFYKLGKQLIEFLQLSKDNSEDVLKKYSEENIKGILNVFKRKEKESLQVKIIEAISYAEKQKINILEIKTETEAINKTNLNKEETEKINEVMLRLEKITKEDLKELSITENADLKRCIENSYIKVMKTYTKLKLNDKNSDVVEYFNNIMDYCIKEIDDKINKNNLSKKHKIKN